jgi:signal transduction histidine kinase/CheY-like chemotaxis protein
MPIRAGDRVVGVINMAKKKEAREPGTLPPFGALDLQFLNTLMTYIGYSVDNARLLEDAQRSAQRLQGVVDDLRATQAAAVRGETLRAIGQLSSGLAHHLNNLLAVILGRVEVLLRKVESEDIRRALDIVRLTALDGAEVVRRVQRFSRVAPVSTLAAVDLNQLAQEVVELTRPRWYDEAQLEGRKIDVVVEAGEIPAVAGEPASLREVLMNLLLNATDAMPGGGRIVIRTWAEADRVCCAVTDTGTGMSEEVRRRALEPFFTTKGPKSMGLGLSVAYGTIERHGGTLAIGSAEDGGTRVTVGLPVAPPAPPIDAPAAAPGPGRALAILMIEDDPRVRETLAEVLQAAGHTVVPAAGGRQGLALLETLPAVDLVVTDLGMPDMTGWEVVRAVRARWPGLPVGLITGWGEEELSAEQRRLVAFVIAKPVESSRLREVVAGVATAREPAPGRPGRPGENGQTPPVPERPP